VEDRPGGASCRVSTLSESLMNPQGTLTEIQVCTPQIEAGRDKKTPAENNNNLNTETGLFCEVVKVSGFVVPEHVYTCHD